MVHAPERAITRLRMGLRRRQPALACVGGLARLQDRKAHPREGRPRLPRKGLPQAAAQLHLVGQSEGPRRSERFPGRVSGTRQYRRLRSLGAPAPGRAHRTVRRDELDGDVLSEHAGDRARTRPDEPRLRRRGQQILRTFRLYRPGHEPPRWRGHQPVGRGGRFLLRCPPPAERQPPFPEGAFDGRSEEHTSELQSQSNLVCRLLLEKKKKKQKDIIYKYGKKENRM